MAVVPVATSRPRSELVRLRSGSMSVASRPQWFMMPPNASATMISQTVLSMLSMPPPETSSSRAAEPLSSSKPVAMASQTPLSMTMGVDIVSSPTKSRTTCGCRITAMRPPVTAPAVIARVGGTLRTASRTTTSSGINARNPIRKMLSIVARPSSRSKAPTGSERRPRNRYSPRAISIEGNVVRRIARMCEYRSVPATAGARFVVSDSGDILSPK